MGEAQPMKVTAIASGSKGNATLIQYKNSAVLVDAGISARRIAKACKELGVPLTSIQGILVTHEHTDHIAGIPQLIKQYGWPVYSRLGTIQAIRYKYNLPESCFVGLTKSTLSLGSMVVEPFKTSHDAAEPMGLSCYGGSTKATVLTDTGYVDDAMLRHVDDSNLLVLEANYDPQMLKYGPYAPMLKQRVAGPEGHLSNEEAGRVLVMMKRPKHMSVIMAHRSENNNDVRVVTDTVDKETAQEGVYVDKDFTMYHGQPKEMVTIISEGEKV
ncbi:MAG: MBL fold metallo-hydrolase [Veillonellaceae bacterium]|nr:MBL fold metallo-hydrolase [Veillonellaceae bacterium]